MSLPAIPGSPSSTSDEMLPQSPVLGQTTATPRPTLVGSPKTSLPMDALPTPGNTTVGVVRRKPTRRANTAERRATHNAVERQRRETLNSRFLDLAALLPNLASVRRPSKSAIVNSSIALVHTQRCLRAIAARELRQLVAEADDLRREVNEWRKTHPGTPVSTSDGPVEEPIRSAEFIALVELEDVPEEEMAMSASERIAYEMRGGENGGMFGEDGDGEDLCDEDLSDSQRPQQASPVVATNSIARARSQSLATRNQHSAPIPVPVAAPAPASLPSHFAMPQPASLAHQQMMPQHANAGFQNSFMPPTFDMIAAAAAGFPSSLGDVEAAKLAAWNAHMYSALAQQQANHHHQQQWAAMHYQTPPGSAQGPSGVLGSMHGHSAHPYLTPFQRSSPPLSSHGHTHSSEDADSDGSRSPAGATNLSSSFTSDAPIAHPGALMMSPNLSVPMSSLSTVGTPGSLPSSMASPLHLNLPNDPFSSFPFGSAPASNGWNGGRSASGTPGIGGMVHHSSPVTAGGGGGGGGGHASYAMMSMFI